MSWIPLVEMNMSFSRNIYEATPSNTLILMAQKIAIYSIIPITLIAAFEAVVKNLIVINFLNFTITILNLIHDPIYACCPWN